MKTMIFDTHATVKRYKAAGFSEEQVEALVDSARETAALLDVSQLATKQSVRAGLKSLETRLLYAMGAVAVAIVGITAVMLTVLFVALKH